MSYPGVVGDIAKIKLVFRHKRLGARHRGHTLFDILPDFFLLLSDGYSDQERYAQANADDQ